jgi:VWFA-related protein
MKTGAAALAMVVAVSAGLGGQQRPQFRGGVDLVEVDAVATDRDGHVVRGLSRDDFAIFEDGQPMAIKTFAAIDADRARVDAEGRLVVLLLDNVVTAPVWTTHIKTIAHDFANHMSPHDVAAVVMLNESATKTTTNPAEINATIETFRYEASKIIPGDAVRRHALDQIRGLFQRLEPVQHRRKLLVLIGAPSLFMPTEATGIGMATYAPEWSDALAAASRANVSLYAIDPAGLTASRPEDAMSFAEATGGVAFNTNEFASAVNRMWDEAGHYYLIGYEAPAGGKRKTHRISVRATRAGIDVRARKQR